MTAEGRFFENYRRRHQQGEPVADRERDELVGLGPRMWGRCSCGLHDRPALAAALVVRRGRPVAVLVVCRGERPHRCSTWAYCDDPADGSAAALALLECRVTEAAG